MLTPSGLSTSNLQTGAQQRLQQVNIILAVADLASQESDPALANQLRNSNVPISAKIISSEMLPGGGSRAQIEIAGKILAANLNQTAQPGTQVLLRFTDLQSLQKTTSGNQSNTLGKNTLVNSNTVTSNTGLTNVIESTITTATTPSLATPVQNATDAKISPFANMINHLLTKLETQTNPVHLNLPANAATHQLNEVTNNVGPQVDHLAQGMHQALEKSGLFYESHLESWIQGNRTTDELKQEPQAKIMGSSESAATPSAQATHKADTQNELSIHERLLPILREQLHVLEQRQFSVQMETWPQQTAQLTIREESREQEAEELAAQHQWRTELKMHLPKLGEVTADLVIHGNDLKINIRAQQNQTANQLQASTTDLSAALQNCGLQVTQCVVQHE